MMLLYETQADGSLAAWDATSLLPTISTPTLVVRGSDEELSEASFSKVASSIPNAQTFSYPFSGNYVHIDAWEPFLELLDKHFTEAEMKLVGAA